MTTKIHACLLGRWVNLCNDPYCVIGNSKVSPLEWYKKNAPLWSPSSKKEHTYYDLDYIHIYYEGTEYRINPIFIQISFD